MIFLGCVGPNGANYRHGYEWNNGCEQNKCLAGVLTTSPIQCFNTCEFPLPPLKGECCPRCPGKLKK